MIKPTRLAGDAIQRAARSARFVYRSVRTSHAPAGVARTRAGRVLVVEDDAVSRQALQLLLEDEGLEVQTLDPRDDAPARMRSATPAVLLLGLRGPSKESLALAWRGRDLAPALPIIVMSAAEPCEYPLSLLLAEPGIEHLQKPIDFERLLATIDRLLVPDA